MKKICAILLALLLGLTCMTALAEMATNTADYDDTEEDFFPEDMKEYVNADPAYSILYPGIFTEDMLVETESGIGAVLPDGSASFLVFCQENTENWSNATWMAAKLQENPELASEVHELNNLVHLIDEGEDVTTMTYCMVTEDWIYVAQLSWNYMHPDFARYCTYMENSFSADELGMG